MVVAESVKRNRDAASSSADVAVPEEDEWHELARKMRRRGGADKDGGDDIDIQGMNADIDEEAENYEDYEFEEGLEVQLKIDDEALQAARREEISFMEGLGVWEPSSWDECVRKTGRAPVSTRWVDVDKGRDGIKDIRSRLVARDFKVRGDRREFDVFASMPPLEAKRLLFRMAMVKGRAGGKCSRGPLKLMFVDVKKAHLNGKLAADEFAFVQLPAEAGGGVGRLRRWLYGMRPAAQAWEKEYSKRLVNEAGYIKGRASSSVFHHPVTGVRLVVWGDDFTFLGHELDLQEVLAQMGRWYDIKMRGILGPDPTDMKEIRILNRMVRWGGEVIEYEADDKHVKTIVADLNLDADSKGSDLPLPREYDAMEDDVELDEGLAKEYRRLAATVNYLALDRPDLQFTAGVLGRTAARPTERSWSNLKKVGRYLLKHPRVVFRYGPCGEEEARQLTTFGDSDWAGCKASRRSVSGGVATLGGAFVKGWSNRQVTVALSSAEAEFYASTKATVETLGLESLMADLGWAVSDKVVLTDSNAARGMASRRGLGRTRHIDVKRLWLQEVVETRGVHLGRVDGKKNPGDPFTKLQAYDEMMNLLRMTGIA